MNVLIDLLKQEVKFSSTVLRDVICIADAYALSCITDFLHKKQYIKLREQTLRLFCRTKIIDSRYDSIITENFHRMENAVILLSKDVKITLDMKKIKFCIERMLQSYDTSLNCAIKLLENSEYARHHEKAQIAINRITNVISNELLVYIPADIHRLIMNYIYPKLAESYAKAQ